MKTAGKVWGSTSEIFATSTFELHLLFVVAGHRCSRHLHRTKFNGFSVLEGALRITVWQPEGTVDVTTLRPGVQLIVPPGVDHMFEALEDTVALEAYWTELRSDDIVRKDTGQ